MIMKKANQSNNKKQKKQSLPLIAKVIIGIGIFIFLSVLGVVFIPSLYSKSYAHSRFNNSVNEKTITQKRDLFQPEYVVFEKHDDGEIVANFIRVDRDFFLFWEAGEISTYRAEAPEGIDESALPEFADENLEDIYDAIKNGKLNKEDAINQQAEAENPSPQAKIDFDETVLEAVEESLEKTEEETSYGHILEEFTDLSGENKVKVVVGLKPNTNEVLLNNKKLKEIKNVIHIEFDLDGGNLYYSGFKPEDVDEPHGSFTPLNWLKKYNIESKQVEEIKTFDGLPVEFMVAENSIMYTLYGEPDYVEIIDLETKDTQKIDISQYSKTEEINPIATIDILNHSSQKSTVLIEKTVGQNETEDTLIEINSEGEITRLR